jgi:hypothetical protein
MMKMSKDLKRLKIFKERQDIEGSTGKEILNFLKKLSNKGYNLEDMYIEAIEEYGNSYAYLKILRDETDEEFNERKKRHEERQAHLKNLRYEQYLELKKEFE